MTWYSLELGVFMYKFSINDLPNAFNVYFTKRSDIHGYKTRHVNDLNLTKNKKHFSDHSVRTTGPILWNSIDKKLKNSKTVKQFRNQYKKTLISNYEQFIYFSSTGFVCLLSCWALLCGCLNVIVFSFFFSFQGMAIYRPYWPSCRFLHNVFLCYF